MIIFIIAFCLCLFACTDNTLKNDPNYVEVSSLKIESANIHIGTEGDAASKQIEVEILPSNATNRALVYEFPSEYTKYITISKTGLITAKTSVETSITIPVRVYSTSNTNASISFNVILEYAPVKRLIFNTDKVELLYNGKGYQIQLSYYPAHAVDGRSVTYTSLDPTIATVTDGGFINPVSVGQTSIKVVSTPSQSEQVEAFLQVEVKYVAAQYLLEYSESAKFNRVIGDASPIDFTIIITGDNTDPNPNVEWYIDEARVAESSNNIQYSHVPTATTQISYRIKVHITPYGETEQTILQSPLITIYKPFSGINLEFENESKVYESFFYGDTHTFALNSSINNVSTYKWYLKETNGTGYESLVATTVPSNKDLTRVLNLEGDYTLTVRAYSDTDMYLGSPTQHTFSTTRLVEGDTLLISPKSKDGGILPESYHWYYVKCDADGNPLDSEGTKTYITDTSTNDNLIYAFPSDGYYKLYVSVTINGILGTIDGEIYYYESSLIHIAKTDEDASSYDDSCLLNTDENIQLFGFRNVKTISQAHVEGVINSKEEKSFLFEFNNNSNVNTYSIEIISADGTPLFFDSADDSLGITFGPSYIIMPVNETINYSTKFSYRIKTKNSLYSDIFYYGSYNELGKEDDHHVYFFNDNVISGNYFSELSYNNARVQKLASNEDLMANPVTNLYIYDFDELIELLDFIITYNPTYCELFTRIISAYNGMDCNHFTVSFYLNPTFFDDNNDLLNMVESFTEGELYVDAQGNVIKYEDLSESQIINFNTKKLLLTALNYVTDPLYYEIRNISRDGNKVTFTIILPREQQVINYTKTVTDENVLTTKSIMTPALGKAYSNSTKFEYELGAQVFSHTSDDLVNILEKGLFATPQTDNLSSMFNKVKELASCLVSNTYSRESMIIAIAEYLALNIQKDDGSKEDNDFSLLEKYNVYSAYHLEGVINDKCANSLGFAYGFSAIAGVLGINTKIVKYTYSEKDTYVNIVFIDDKAYIVDVYDAAIEINGIRTLNLAYVLIDETQLKELIGSSLVLATTTETSNMNLLKTYKLFDMYSLYNSYDSANLLTELSAGKYAITIAFDANQYNTETIKTNFGIDENEELSVISLGDLKIVTIILNIE